MGLFDRFKRRVQEVAEDVDSEELTATEDSEEGQVALQTGTCKMAPHFPGTKHVQAAPPH